MEEEEALAVLTLLNDDIRRRLYRFVRRAAGPVTREEAAKAVSISAKLAAFHLDKLVEGGLLEADFETPRGLRRRVGRAPKRYRPSEVEVSLSLPERRYDLVGEILVDTLNRASDAQQPVEAAKKVAFERGHRIGTARKEQLRRGRLGAERTLGEARGLLEDLGYEPADAEVELVLRNCPFHALAQRSPELVCGLNASFVDGILRGLGNDTVAAELAPEEGLCCVRLLPPAVTKGSLAG
jgi:predicted ArsR family transcriptional regulator